MFAEILVQILQDKQLKPYHVAKATGISAGLMSDYVNNKKQPTLSNLIKIADYLDVSVDKLLGRENEQCDESSSEPVYQIPFYSDLTPEYKELVDRVIEALSRHGRDD